MPSRWSLRKVDLELKPAELKELEDAERAQRAAEADAKWQEMRVNHAEREIRKQVAVAAVEKPVRSNGEFVALL